MGVVLHKIKSQALIEELINHSRQTGLQRNATNIGVKTDSDEL